MSGFVAIGKRSWGPVIGEGKKHQDLAGCFPAPAYHGRIKVIIKDKDIKYILKRNILALIIHIVVPHPPLQLVATIPARAVSCLRAINTHGP